MAAAAAAAVAAAVMVMAVVVVIAADAGDIVELPGQIVGHSLVRRAGDAAEELDAGLSQGGLRAAADAAAQQHVHLGCAQKACQRAVAWPLVSTTWAAVTWPSSTS